MTVSIISLPVITTPIVTFTIIAILISAVTIEAIAPKPTLVEAVTTISFLIKPPTVE